MYKDHCSNDATDDRAFNFSTAQRQQLEQLTLADFDFDLPGELIAQHPSSQRSQARLLDATATNFNNHIFADLPNLLRQGDLLIFNDTKVIKARLFGHKDSGGKVEILVERVLDNGIDVIAHFKASRKPQTGTTINMAGGFSATLLGRWPNESGNMFLFRFSADAYRLMEQFGHVPLPPYITHSDSSEDEQRYQTVFARTPGAVAAPTAALHFDETILAQLQQRGIQTAHITLHVGAGTFQPIKGDDILQHHMHYERYHISAETLSKINTAKNQRRRIVAVGTTSVRALESYALSGRTTGETDIFITPGFTFKLTDLLITNFHLPKSTLLLLVSAFSGLGHIRRVYDYAIANRFRFFSYGDAMLLQRQS